MFQSNYLDYLRNWIRPEDRLAVAAPTQAAQEMHATLALDFRKKLRAQSSLP